MMVWCGWYGVSAEGSWSYYLSDLPTRPFRRVHAKWLITAWCCSPTGLKSDSVDWRWYSQLLVTIQLVWLNAPVLWATPSNRPTTKPSSELQVCTEYDTPRLLLDFQSVIRLSLLWDVENKPENKIVTWNNEIKSPKIEVNITIRHTVKERFLNIPCVSQKWSRELQKSVKIR